MCKQASATGWKYHDGKHLKTNSEWPQSGPVTPLSSNEAGYIRLPEVQSYVPKRVEPRMNISARPFKPKCLEGRAELRINNETRRIRKVAALCLHKMLATFRILCDDCHDDELRKERRVRVEGERDTTVIERRS